MRDDDDCDDDLNRMGTPDAKKMRKGDIDDDTDEEDLLVYGGGGNGGPMILNFMPMF